MYNNILIITDNPILGKRFEKFIGEDTGGKRSFHFAISPFSSVKEFQEALNRDVLVFNMKEDQDVEEIINRYDLVFSIHCKQIFPKKLVESVKCINVHPGYNPINRGWYPQIFAIIHDLPIGATIHEIDEKLDHGKIIAREFVSKNNWDTSKDIYDKVVDKEMELLEKNLGNILNGNYQVIAPEEEGKVYLKKDFWKLLELDLNEEASFGTFLDRLRALTHGTYKNAFFTDPETGRKVYVNIELEVEEDETQK